MWIADICFNMVNSCICMQYIFVPWHISRNFCGHTLCQNHYTIRQFYNLVLDNKMPGGLKTQHFERKYVKHLTMLKREGNNTHHPPPQASTPRPHPTPPKYTKIILQIVLTFLTQSTWMLRKGISPSCVISSAWAPILSTKAWKQTTGWS